MARMPALIPMNEIYPPKVPDAVAALVDGIVAFRPDGGGPVELRRALAVAERNDITARKATLERWLEPGSPQKMTMAIADMMMGFPGSNVSVEDAEAICASYAFSCRELPTWAVQRSCLRFRSGQVRPAEIDEKTIGFGFRPSSAHLCKVAEALARPLRVELDRIEAVFKGTVTPSAPPRTAPAGVTAAQAHIVDRDQRAALECDERIKRQQAAAPGVERRNNDARIAEYARAGLKPPEPHGGIVVSLSMMLKMGFAIATVKGKKVLVQANKQGAEA
jgi:hypothetical protein